MRLIARTVRKHEQLITYLICGLLTTAVNFAAYRVLTARFGMRCVRANVLAWTAAVAAAFLVNKVLVFRSRDWAPRTVLRELYRMALAKLLTLGLETGILYASVQALHADRIEVGLGPYVRTTGDMFVKLAAGILVVLTNYGLTRTVIFPDGKRN